MDLLTTFGLVVPAGLNAYIPLLAISLAQRFGLLHLRAPYDLIGAWWATALIGVLLVVEIVADKVPAVDHANDVVQSFIRPAAGGLIAVATVPAARDIHPAVLIVAGIVVAGAVHVGKAASRPAMNAASGGVAAPVASFFEDVAAGITSILAVVAPYLVGAVILLGAGGLAYLYLRWRARRRGTVDEAEDAAA